MNVRAAAALFVLGCGAPPGEQGAVVLTIGEHEFTHADFDRFREARLRLAGNPDAPLLSAVYDEFARERLLLIAADEAGVGIPEAELDEELRALDQGPGDEALLREEVRDRLRVERLLDTVVLADLEVTDEAIRFEYETSRALYARPETITLSERRLPSREAADAGSFLRIGTFRRGELPDTVDEAVFALAVGETTGVIETPAGFRVFRVDERLPAAALDLEEVEEIVRMTVLRREADALVEAFVADLERRHPVRVHAARLDFPYVGQREAAEQGPKSCG